MTYLSIMNRVAMFVLALALVFVSLDVAAAFWFHFPAIAKFTILISFATVCASIFSVRVTRFRPAPAPLSTAQSNVRVAVFWGVILTAVAGTAVLLHYGYIDTVLDSVVHKLEPTHVFE